MSGVCISLRGTAARAAGVRCASTVHVHVQNYRILLQLPTQLCVVHPQMALQ